MIDAQQFLTASQETLTVLFDFLYGAGPETEIPEYRRHFSVPAETVTADTPEEGSVLKKVASLTLSKLELETKICKPKFVPEKLDFQLYEKFEGEK